LSPAGLAWRYVTRQPARAALGIAGIAVVGALLFDMLLLSRGLVVSFRDILESAGFDVRVTATETPPTLGPPLRDAARVASVVGALPEVREVVPLRFGKAETPGPDGALLGVSLFGSGTRDGYGWPVVRGSGLTPGSDERTLPVVINRRLASRLGLGPGSKLRLTGACASAPSAAPPVELDVQGIVAFPFDTTTELSAMTTLPAFLRTCAGEDPEAADLLLVASRAGGSADGTVAAIRRALPGVHAFSNEQLLDRFQRTDFSYFRQISFVLSSITLFFAFLLVTTLLTVSVNQRFGELAVLRALGVRRRRVVASLLYESAILVGTGGLIALPIGAGLALWLDGILKGMPELPERLHFFVFEPRAVLLHVALIVVTALLAAIYPAYLAARLPIAGTLRREVVS
jgi:putative ABC transport system permease protein